jgi:streptogramin lyase
MISIRSGIVGSAIVLLLLSGGCGDSGPVAPCDVPGVICTVAGTGLSAFDGDGRSALDTSLYFPLDLAFDPVGRLLVLDYNNLRVRRINDDDTVETVMGLDFEDLPVEGALAVDTPLHHASDVEFDDTGNMFVAGNHAPIVFKVGVDNRVSLMAGSGEFGNDGDGGPAGEATLSSPFAVVPSSDGGFYIADVEVHVVRFVDAAGTISTVAGTGAPGYSGDDGPGRQAQLNQPTRLRLDAAGTLYIADSGNHAIRRLDVDGTITTFAGTGQAGYSGDGGAAVAAQFQSPYDLQFAPDGSLYVADSGNHVIRRIDAAGTVTTVAGKGIAGFAGDELDASDCELNRPTGIKFDADGAMWIADTYNHRVRRVAGFLNSAAAR